MDLPGSGFHLGPNGLSVPRNAEKDFGPGNEFVPAATDVPIFALESIRSVTRRLAPTSWMSPTSPPGSGSNL